MSAALFDGCGNQTTQTGTPPSSQGASPALPSLITPGRQQLHGHVTPEMARATVIGRVPPDTKLTLTIHLLPRDAAALKAAAEQVSDPKSPGFRHYLTPNEFGEQFGASASDYETVVSWSESKHLSVTSYPNRLVVAVTGLVVNIEDALDVHLNYALRPDGSEFRTPDAEPSLDLSVPIQFIGNLENYVLPRRAGGSGRDGDDQGLDFRTAYVPNTALDGAGQRIGIFMQDGFWQSDIDGYAKLGNLGSVLPVQIVSADPFTPSTGVDYTEGTMDIEAALSMAPRAQVVGYMGDTMYILNEMVNDPKTLQFSCSWGSDIGSVAAIPTMVWRMEQMALSHQSFFVASGNYGAYGKGATGDSGPEWVGDPTEWPYVTLVGGTTLNMSDYGSSYGWETTWSIPTRASGGGILSNQNCGSADCTGIPLPLYQTGFNKNGNGASQQYRNSPDVSAAAYDVNIFYDGHIVGNSGGTSFSSPLWAGFMALVNEEASNRNAQPVGFANPFMYAIANDPFVYRESFHDINDNSRNPDSFDPTIFYSAVTGYDLATGLGSPKCALIERLLSLSSDPPAGLHDADGDGIYDPCDPCPCGGNDDDNDGFCSQCRTDLVTDIGWFCAGYCPTHPIDNCPNIPTPDLNDYDVDGIGDLCDGCPGIHLPIPPQTADKAQIYLYQNCALGVNSSQSVNDTRCIQLFGDKSTCVATGNTGAIGSCSRGTDTDGDGLDDVCDNCVHVKNTTMAGGIAMWEANCNLESEVLDTTGNYHYPYVGDSCDSTPCSYASYTVMGGTPIAGVAWQNFTYSPLFLPASTMAENYQGSYPYNSAPQETVGGRYCPYGDSIKDAPNYLAWSGHCSVDTAYYTNGSTPAPIYNPWFQPTLYAASKVNVNTATKPDPSWAGANLTNSALSGLTAQVPPYDVNLTLTPWPVVPAQDRTVWWYVGGDWGAQSYASAGFGNLGIIGIYWTHVPSVLGVIDDQDQEQYYKPVSNHYVPGFFGYVGKYGLSQAVNWKTFGSCYPVWKCILCPGIQDTPDWLVNPVDRQLTLISSTVTIDYTNEAADVIDSLASDGTRALTVEEQPELRNETSPMFAVMASDGSSIKGVIAPRGDYLSNISKPAVTVALSGIHLDSPASPAAPAQNPAARSGFGAVLSSSESAVFVIGGEIEGTSTLAGDIWQYDIASRNWFAVHFTGVAPSHVVASTYRPQDRSLFLVDEVAAGGGLHARLVQVNLATRESRVLGSWPRHSVVDTVFLSVGPNGEIVLLGSSAQLDIYAGVVLTTVHSDLEVVGGVLGHGQVGARPTLTLRGLTIPVHKGTIVENVFVPAGNPYLSIKQAVGAVL